MTLRVREMSGGQFIHVSQRGPAFSSRMSDREIGFKKPSQLSAYTFVSRAYASARVRLRAKERKKKSSWKICERARGGSPIPGLSQLLRAENKARVYDVPIDGQK